jgi:hypothetical protein
LPAEITEGEFLEVVTKTENVVCHFYHKDFERCKIVDKHLVALAKKYLEARFVKISAPVSLPWNVCCSTAVHCPSFGMRLISCMQTTWAAASAQPRHCLHEADPGIGWAAAAGRCTMICFPFVLLFIAAIIADVALLCAGFAGCTLLHCQTRHQGAASSSNVQRRCQR